MSWLPWLGRSTPRSTSLMERDLEDALEQANAAIDAEHTAVGGHAGVTLDSLASRTGDPVVMNTGLRFTKGPWIFEQDLDTAGGTAALRAPQITANQNDYAPTGISDCVVLEVESDAARNLTGVFLNPRRRRFLWLVNRGNFTITIKHNSVSSTAAYRIAVSNSADFALRSGGIALLYYDIGAGNWRIEANAGMTQIRSVQSKAITFNSAGGTAQNYTLDTTLADYTLAYVATLQETSTGREQFSAPIHAAKLTSATNLQVLGSDATSYSLFYTVIEYQNLG